MSEATETASPPVLELNGARATIRLNRPKHLNRLQPDDLDALLKLFDRIEADPAIRGAGADRHRPRLQRRLRSQFGRRARRQRGRRAKRRIGVRSRRQPARGYRRSHHLPAQWRRLWRLDRSGAGLRFPHRRRHLRDVHAGGAARAALLQERHRALCLAPRRRQRQEAVPDRAEDRRGGDAADRLSHRDGAGRGARRGGRQARDHSCRQCADRDARHETRPSTNSRAASWTRTPPTAAHRDSMRGDEIKEGIKAFAEKRPPKF